MISAYNSLLQCFGHVPTELKFKWELMILYLYVFISVFSLFYDCIVQKIFRCKDRENPIHIAWYINIFM